MALLESSIKKSREIKISIIYKSILISRKTVDIFDFPNHFHFTEKTKSVGLTISFHAFSTFTKKDQNYLVDVRHFAKVFIMNYSRSMYNIYTFSPLRSPFPPHISSIRSFSYKVNNIKDEDSAFLDSFDKKIIKSYDDNVFVFRFWGFSKKSSETVLPTYLAY